MMFSKASFGAILLATALLCASVVSGHPEPLAAGVTVNCTDHPAPMSYHIHIIFMQYDTDQMARAVALRTEFESAFAHLLGPDPKCSAAVEGGRYNNGRFCMIYDHTPDQILAGAPFPAGEWSAFVTVPVLPMVVPWLTQHRGEFTLLVHPNTGCEYEDHSIWALWSGPQWPLDLVHAKMIPWQQTNEFNHTLGDAGNPECLKSGLVCGKSYPQMACCSGSCAQSQQNSLLTCQ